MRRKSQVKKFIEDNYSMINSLMAKEESNEIKDVSKILLETINQSIKIDEEIERARELQKKMERRRKK